jgi:hypothetical protein
MYQMHLKYNYLTIRPFAAPPPSYGFPLSVCVELLTFSGNRETKEDRSGTKHIEATDLLKEMTRRRTVNPDWDDAATIAHCARSFRNDVAVWWPEVVPSDNSPKQLKKINTSWERFERIFRRAWIIETTLPPQAWLDDNPQKQEESSVDYITRVQEASLPAAMAALNQGRTKTQWGRR